jgi:hypothetical protein
VTDDDVTHLDFEIDPEQIVDRAALCLAIFSLVAAAAKGGNLALARMVGGAFELVSPHQLGQPFDPGRDTMALVLTPDGEPLGTVDGRCLV